MALVCNSVASSLVITIPNACSGFVQNEVSAAPCGAGTSSATCALSISGGVPPYNTTFSYSQTPNIVQNCTVNAGAFTGGGGSNPSFGFGFSASNMCNLYIRGILQLAYTVTDASGQTTSGNAQYDINIQRSVLSTGCDCTVYGPNCYEVRGACRCPGEVFNRPCYL